MKMSELAARKRITFLDLDLPLTSVWASYALIDDNEPDLEALATDCNTTRVAFRFEVLMARHPP
jgi:hypothetical protein